MADDLSKFPARRGEGDALDPLLDAALAHLPRERAGDRFTGAVLSRARRAEVSQTRWRFLAAAALFFTAAGVAVGEWNERLAQEAAAERIAELRAEYSLLREELLELQRASELEEEPGVIYLGSSDGIDYVVDLQRLASRSARGAGDYRYASQNR
ncbi:MAG: hypothetical protein AAF725_19960 [Acidobacteriota bacterium]